MKNKATTDLFFTSMGQVLFVIITLNLLGLLFELIVLDNFDNYNLTFKHGYFILNDDKVGINLFANLFGFVAVSLLYTFWQSNTQKRKQELN